MLVTMSSLFLEPIAKRTLCWLSALLPEAEAIVRRTVRRHGDRVCPLSAEEKDGARKASLMHSPCAISSGYWQYSSWLYLKRYIRNQYVIVALASIRHFLWRFIIMLFGCGYLGNHTPMLKSNRIKPSFCFSSRVFRCSYSMPANLWLN